MCTGDLVERTFRRGFETVYPGDGPAQVLSRGDAVPGAVPARRVIEDAAALALDERIGSGKRYVAHGAESLNGTRHGNSCRRPRLRPHGAGGSEEMRG